MLAIIVFQYILCFWCRIIIDVSWLQATRLF